jgi:5'-phosphate synthase pdxT subunit
MKIGVLALQGNFENHMKELRSLGIEPVKVRYPSQLDQVEGLVIPGGESTTLTRLMKTNSFFEPVKTFAKSYPVLGTCAGLIMMARKINDVRVKTLGMLDVTVKRNLYGRQVHSFSNIISVHFDSRDVTIPATFIRAPQIIEIGPSVQVLATCANLPVAVLDGFHMGTTFHPEIYGISLFHEWLFQHARNEIISARISRKK